MPRTFHRQSTQIRPSDTYNGNLTPGSGLLAQANIEGDLNALRSVTSLLGSEQTGAWYADLTAPSSFEGGAKRPADTINADLHELEKKRVLVQTTHINDVLVAKSGQIDNIEDPEPLPSYGATWNVREDGAGDFTSIQAAIDSPSVAAGDRLRCIGLFTLTATVNVNKSVFIQGDGMGAGVQFTTAASGAAPVTMFNVTASNVTFYAMHIKHQKTTNTSLESCINLVGGSGATGYFVEQCYIECVEHCMIVKADSYQINNCALKYSGPNNSTRRLISIYRSAVKGLITNNDIHSGQGGAVTGNTRFIQVTTGASPPDEVLGGYLRIGANGHGGTFGPNPAIHQFINIDSFAPAATPLELVLDGNECSETSAFLVFFLPNTRPPLSQCSSISLVGNSLTNSHGKGAIAMDGASALASPGTTTFYAYDNVLTSTTFQAAFETAIDGTTDPAELALIGRATARWSDPNQTIQATTDTDTNFVVLTAAKLPTATTAGIGNSSTVIGTVAAQASPFGAHSLAEVAGKNAIAPKNLCMVVESISRDPILSGGRVIYALFQSESSTDGSTMTGSSPNRAQLSFVRLNSAGDDLEAVPNADIGGKTIHYSSVTRRTLEGLTEEMFLVGAEFDYPSEVSVSRQLNYDEQLDTPVEMTGDADLAMGAGLSWTIRDDAENVLFSVSEDSAGSASTVSVSSDVASLDVDAVSNDFAHGMSVASGSLSPIDMGTTDGRIETTAGDLAMLAAGGLFAEASVGDLMVRSGLGLLLADGNIAASGWGLPNGIALADNTAEWSAFESAYGSVSLLQAVVDAQNVSSRGGKTYVDMAAPVAPDNDVSLGVDLSGGSFGDDYDIFINGNLQEPGTDSGTSADYYPGGDLTTGQIRFKKDLLAGDVVSVVVYNN